MNFDERLALAREALLKDDDLIKQLYCLNQQTSYIGDLTNSYWRTLFGNIPLKECLDSTAVSDLDVSNFKNGIADKDNFTLMLLSMAMLCHITPMFDLVYASLTHRLPLNKQYVRDSATNLLGFLALICDVLDYKDFNAMMGEDGEGVAELSVVEGSLVEEIENPKPEESETQEMNQTTDEPSDSDGSDSGDWDDLIAVESLNKDEQQKFLHFVQNNGEGRNSSYEILDKLFQEWIVGGGI